MGKSLKEAGTYKYTIQFDGSVLKKDQKITIRRMSDDERGRFLRKKAAILHRQIAAFVPAYASGTMPTDDVERLHREAMKIATQLCEIKARRRVAELDDFENLLDLTGFIGHVIRVESCMESGDDMPEQFDLLNIGDVDDLDEDEIDKQLEEAERLGETGQPNESPTTTAVIDSPVETSSSSSDLDSTEGESEE